MGSGIVTAASDMFFYHQMLPKTCPGVPLQARGLAGRSCRGSCREPCRGLALGFLLRCSCRFCFFCSSARCFCSLVRSALLLLPCLCSAASALLFHVLWLCCAMIFLFLLFCFCPSASATCPCFSAHGLLLLLCCSCSSLSSSAFALLLLLLLLLQLSSPGLASLLLLFFWCIGGS